MGESYRKIAGHLLCLVLAAGLALFASAGASAAQERLTERQIIRALQPAPQTRGLSGSSTDNARAPEDRRFIDELRKLPARSLTLADREHVALIAETRPKIDLEVYFEYNSASLAYEAVPALVTLGRALVSPELKGKVFMIGGHTDAKGGDEYNLDLSKRRAQAVERFLEQNFDLHAENFLVVGFGKEQLKNKADPFAAENRRVQIVTMADQAVASQ
jgi:outer membrane protein OmpA-like peptidoglycan-associated protein